MRIAVTGASGFIGGQVIGDPTHEWVPLSRGASNGGLAPGETGYSLESLQRAFDGVDGVVHLASEKMNGPLGDNETILHENLRVAEAVYSACAAVGVRRLVNVSSRMVYGPRDRMPWTEGADVHPTTYYGLSKLCSEKLAGVCLGPESPCRVVHLRIPQVLGVPGSGVDEHVITSLLRNANAGEDLVVAKDVRRQYIHIKDVVEVILRSLATDGASGVFNVAMPGYISVGEAAREIESVFGGPSTVVAEKTGTEAPVEVWMDVAKARSELGFVSGWSFREPVLDIWEQMRR